MSNRNGSLFLFLFSCPWWYRMISRTRRYLGSKGQHKWRRRMLGQWLDDLDALCVGVRGLSLGHLLVALHAACSVSYIEQFRIV
jgi:hypothetical protein